MIEIERVDSVCPLRPPWTAPGAQNGWLVLDRDGDGTIDSAAEMFGNMTEQPPGPNPNGFNALAVFDLNHDGKIDASDPIYRDLRIWIDSNHDGISQPNELHTLYELGIVYISLEYTLTKKVDDHGNVFRYRAKVGTSKAADVDHFAYDVVLRTK